MHLIDICCFVDINFLDGSMKKYSWPEAPVMSAFPIARPGFIFIGIAVFTTILLAAIGFSFLAFISLLATLFVCFFFRDPDRVICDDEGAVSSPADGKVIFAEMTDDNPYFEGPCKKISIFMSVFNVHVNRIPFDGIIKDVQYTPGKFVNASLDKASAENEKNALVIETEEGQKYAVVQVAGLVARRIVCGARIGDAVKRGTRFGLICFGSRLDIFLPPDATLNVKNGEKVQAGTTILGYMKNGN